MWEKNNISAEIAISITKWDKKSSWYKLIKDYLKGKKKKMNRRKVKKDIEYLMEGIVFLPLHSGNKKMIERVKRVWIGRGLYKDPKIDR